MLKEAAEAENISILAITESHLNSGFHEGEIAMDNYGHFRADRSEGTRKGGVILYVRSELLPGATLLSAGSESNIEYLVVKIPEAYMTAVCIYSRVYRK